MKKTSVLRSVRLDAETDESLHRLAEQFDRNLSMGLRHAIRTAMAVEAVPEPRSGYKGYRLSEEVEAE